MKVHKNIENPVVIVSATRTPLGGLLGIYKNVPAPALGATVLKSALSRAAVKANEVDAVIMGCVLPAGQGQAPARQAALGAGLSTHTDCTTVNKVCGSGMKAVMLAHDLLMADTHRVILAGGMENMTLAPHLAIHTRAGYRAGHQILLDHMFYDGLEDAYQKGRLMGTFAESCAQHFKLSRAAQDHYATISLQRAQKAVAEGLFTQEITPVTLSDGTTLAQDELPGKLHVEKIPTLKPSFTKDGTITAANSSSISDGAAALLLMRQQESQQRGLTPLATIIAQSSHSQAPADFPTAPIEAIQKLFAKTGWSAADVDLFEINEAFAVVVMAAMQVLQLSHDNVNVHGGACALGHPIGATGARILTTLLYALKQRHKKRGIASLCIGGGEATAIAVELM